MTLLESIELSAGWQYRRGDRNIAVSIILTREEYERDVLGSAPEGRIP